MTKDELKDRISMALKDPILQQGFEIICKENAELKKKNNNLVASSKTIISLSDEIENRTMEQITKAKELLKWFVWYFREGSPNLVPYKHKVAEAEQFLKEFLLM